jgi:hypothetical protein
MATQPQKNQLPPQIQNQLTALNARISNFNNLRTQTLEIAVSDLYTQTNILVEALIMELQKTQRENEELKKKLEEATKKP